MRPSSLLGLIVLVCTTNLVAQIPVSKDPRHRVVFENAQLRILDVSIPAGEASQEHLHEYDIATVSMTSGTETRIQSPGQSTPSARPPRPLGDATVAEYAGKPASHRIENVGKGSYQLFAVENLRPNGWTPLDSIRALGTSLTTDARAFRIYDVRLSTLQSQTSHTHKVPTIAVLIAGKLISDGPDKQAKANAPAPVGLRQLDQPGQWVLVPAGDTHHVVRIGTDDARLVEIEVR